MSESYRECLRNHAASLGSYATDGCGEFTSPAPDHTSLHCAACGCHRNFHRKVTYASTRALINNNNGSGIREMGSDHNNMNINNNSNSNVKLSSGGGGGSSKRFRTKFSSEQKEKMLVFAEKIGWRLQRKDLEEEIERFCRSVGVTRQVFKVWMHNHKNNINGSSLVSLSSSANASSLTTDDQ